eukprot:scaffold79432_cov34-Tisochrysis_lutea.AAC.1
MPPRAARLPGGGARAKPCGWWRAPSREKEQRGAGDEKVSPREGSEGGRRIHGVELGARSSIKSPKVGPERAVATSQEEERFICCWGCLGAGKGRAKAQKQVPTRLGLAQQQSVSVDSEGLTCGDRR